MRRTAAVAMHHAEHEPWGTSRPGLRAALRASMGRMFRHRRVPEAPPSVATGSAPDGMALPPPRDRAATVAGSQPGWLRVLTGEQVLQSVQADRALQEIWRQTRLSEREWQRALYPAIVAYAALVQLLPASEAHHHAHAGGLIAHTIEMVLAAVTWRNGVLLPAGAPIEAIDAQRDAWTLVVFIAALLHDVAKVVTDLVVQWRTTDMPESLRWVPLAGSLTAMAHERPGAEYLVQFRPKAERDYTAHARAAIVLLPRIVPASTLTWLGRQPHAFDCLHQYLSGMDQESAVAHIVRDADKASAQRALLTGSRARFATATVVPLVDLMMQALQTMLREGAHLPLNRSGAAGWVHDGSLWLVAKRAADATRQWIQAHAPDASVPGETKNDRLFDTWQEHGCLMRNPLTGQAIWYVTVHGQAAAAEDAQDSGGPTYCHSLSVLRFPLSQLYAEPAQYPAPMRGHIDILTKRTTASADLAPHSCSVPERMTALQDSADETASGARAEEPAAPDLALEPIAAPMPRRRDKRTPPSIKAPTFNQPQSAAVVRPRDVDPSADAPPPAEPSRHPVGAAGTRAQTAPRPIFDELSLQVDGDSEAAWVLDRPPVHAATQRDAPTTVPNVHAASPAAQLSTSLRLPRMPFGAPPPPDANAAGAAHPMGGEHDTALGPVLLRPRLPPLSGELGPKRGASALAVGFITWLQAALSSHGLTYNETGAAVHFVPEGMALVSPAIFKRYAQQHAEADTADELAMRVQREVIKAGWHMGGPNRTNIVRYAVLGRGNTVVARLAALVLVNPHAWVQPVPPVNPVLRID
jgi:integrating conjugative element relaxase (TIGR03760 family)